MTLSERIINRKSTVNANTVFMSAPASSLLWADMEEKTAVGSYAGFGHLLDWWRSAHYLESPPSSAFLWGRPPLILGLVLSKVRISSRGDESEESGEQCLCD